MHFVSLRKLYTIALLTLATATLSAQTLTGVVTNKTDNKVSAGDDVVLLKLAQGMQELARTTTDARGHYKLQIPADEATSMHLVRVTHERANYFKPVPPNTAKVDLEVYTAAAEVEGVAVSEDVMQIQTTPDGGTLRIVEHFLVQNQSSPAKTLFSDHPFEVYLPAGAVVDGSSAKAPEGMAVEQPMVPLSAAGSPDAGHYTMIFPIRPGETEFNVWYHIPYTGSFTLQPRPAMPTDALGIMLPKSMTFKAAPNVQYTLITEQVGGRAQAFLARNVKPSEPLGFTVSGKGELPRDTSVQGSGGTGAPGAASSTAAQGDPNTDTRPGGGLGTPLDKDADRDPLTKYRWWIIGGLGLALAAAAGFLFRAPRGPLPAPALPYTPTAPPASTALQVLRDEMFAVETDRLEGRLTEAQYNELKAAYDIVLRRALSRTTT